jgi:calcineurin-like phosphoesterase
MTGSYDSVIGAEKKDAIHHFLTQMPTKFTPAKGDLRFCAVLIDIDEETGKARHIERMMKPLGMDEGKGFSETEE